MHIGQNSVGVIGHPRVGWGEEETGRGLPACYMHKETSLWGIQHNLIQQTHNKYSLSCKITMFKGRIYFRIASLDYIILYRCT